MNLFDRYITRNFLQAYVYCIVGFIAIWLIFDISDSISSFFDLHFTFGRVLEFYATQIPQILVILLPVSLLLRLFRTELFGCAARRNGAKTFPIRR